MRAVTVFVCNQKGVALPNKSVQEYGKDKQYTNQQGIVNLVISEKSTAIYVEGSQIFSDYGYNAPETLVHKI